jgi:hypothetical protein
LEAKFVDRAEVGLRVWKELGVLKAERVAY